jgi:putative ABC transport system ATP-binding protein
VAQQVADIILQATDVHKVYDAFGPPALRGVSLSVARGEFVAIMGRSGSGKSTLLNLLGALDRPSSGRVDVDGVDVGAVDERRRTLLRRDTIGLVFQSFNLLSALDVVENVELPLLLAGWERRVSRARADEAVDTVGLAHRRTATASRLSGGEQQRVAIARAIVARPSVLLADEPTGSLDSENIETVLQLLARLRAELGLTVVVVTHDSDVAVRSDRIIMLRDGRVCGELVLGPSAGSGSSERRADSVARWLASMSRVPGELTATA